MRFIVKESLKKTIYVLAVLFIGSSAHAQVGSNGVSKPSTLTPTTVSGSLSLARSSSLYDFNDGTRRDGMDYTLGLSAKFLSQFNLSLQGAYSQDLHDSQGNDYSDTSLSLSHDPKQLNKYILNSNSLGVLIPTSKLSSRVQNLYSGVRASTSFILNPELAPSWNLSTTFGIGQNFHQYSTDINGKVLNQYIFNQALSLAYSVKALSFSVSFTHKNAKTYQNSLKESYELTEETAYTLNKNMALAIGHTNAGSALKANGSDSNYALINDNDSIVYLATSVMF